jgi:dTDP-4-dehydrorhamnose 3,5-epimerase
MTFTPTPLSGTFIIDLSLFKDGRGWFARTYCKNEFKQIGFSKEWLQLNHSFTFHKGSVRGMHYQLFPHQEIKLVRCIAGSIYDIIIDLRKESSTFLKWFGIELSAANKKMLYIPEGFAHGFQTLTDNCELIYHHSEFYAPSAEAGVRYNDSMIKINWPLAISEISERDANHSLLDLNFKGI